MIPSASWEVYRSNDQTFYVTVPICIYVMQRCAEVTRDAFLQLPY